MYSHDLLHYCQDSRLPIFVNIFYVIMQILLKLLIYCKNIFEPYLTRTSFRNLNILPSSFQIPTIKRILLVNRRTQIQTGCDKHSGQYSLI